MKSIAAMVMLVVAIAAGTWSDRPQIHAAMSVGGYRVLAADFHVHSTFPGAALLGPWDLVLEARRQGIDAFALTPHNQIVSAKIGRWFSRLVRGPLVIVGEEVRRLRYHLIAAGIEQQIAPTMPAVDAIAEVHRQGGVAIAAHPIAEFWPAYSGAALAQLDAAEVMQPRAFFEPYIRLELQQFLRRGGMTPIGSSDYHGIGALGLPRTYVFATGESEAAVLDAVRAGRTVVYGVDGEAYGDSKLIRLAAADGRLPIRNPDDRRETTPAVLSRLTGILALLAATSAVYRRATTIRRRSDAEH